MPACSARLKDLRIEAGLSQSRLARAADVDRGTVVNAEAGKRISDLSAAKLAKALSSGIGRKIPVSEIAD